MHINDLHLTGLTLAVLLTGYLELRYREYPLRALRAAQNCENHAGQIIKMLLIYKRPKIFVKIFEATYFI